MTIQLSGLGRTLSSGGFNWPRLVTKEYGSAYIWIVAVLLVTAKNLWVAEEHDTHPLPIRWLWLGVAITTMAYVTARILKKTGRLQG